VVRRQNLSELVDGSDKGRVFWIAPGVHHLGTSQYSSVTPKDRQVFIGAPGAIIDGGKKNLYAFTGNASDVTISHLTIQHFGTKLDNNGAGVVNHDSAHGWRVLHNTIRDNGGAGVFLGDHGRVRSNCLKHNGEYGFQSLVSHGGALTHNEIAGNNTADWEHVQPGCGCTGGGKFWDSRNVTIRDNWVHHNHGAGLWADTNNRGLLFDGNYVGHNDDEGLVYEISYNARIVHNTFVANGWAKGPSDPGFPSGAIYISESGSDPRVHTRFSHKFLIAHNKFFDNWSGVIGWENADRFAGSPNNSSAGYSTLVNRHVADLHTCVAGTISSAPYYDDCRWKTQHLRIRHNLFVSHASAIPGCTADRGCGYQGLFSNWGTSPDWSPYQGPVIERHITRTQDNGWSDNHYVGRWHFMARDQSGTVSWHTWRGRFKQDRHSRRS
jgi:nitrous oxidase accessory protein NosD